MYEVIVLCTAGHLSMIININILYSTAGWDKKNLFDFTVPLNKNAN